MDYGVDRSYFTGHILFLIYFNWSAVSVNTTSAHRPKCTLVTSLCWLLPPPHIPGRWEEGEQASRTGVDGGVAVSRSAHSIT